MQCWGDKVSLRICDCANERRGCVDDDGAAFHGLVVGAGLEQVAGEEAQSARRLLGHTVQVGDLARVLGIAHGGVDGDAGVEQALGDPATQVAGGAGDLTGLLVSIGIPLRTMAESKLSVLSLECAAGDCMAAS